MIAPIIPIWTLDQANRIVEIVYKLKVNHNIGFEFKTKEEAEKFELFIQKQSQNINTMQKDNFINEFIGTEYKKEINKCLTD